jgi:outer membrane lipoprotein-sorting protein
MVCLGVVAPSITGAQTLQGAHVLDLMVSKLSGIRTLQVEQQTTIEGGTGVGERAALTEKLSYAFPERFRSDTWLAHSHRIHVVVPNETLTIIDGHISAFDNPLDRYKDLLLYRSRAVLHKKLYTYGVDVEKTSLGRFGEQAVYVLGADYPDDNASQLMIDKESLLPLRWLNILGQNPEERVEFVYTQWQKTGEAWYPKQIEIFSNQRLIRRIRTLGFEVNVALPSDAFDTARLKRVYPPAAPVGLPSTNPLEDEVQRTIEDFQKKFSTE